MSVAKPFLVACAICFSAGIGAAEPRTISAQDLGFSLEEIDGSLTFEQVKHPQIYAMSGKFARVYGKAPSFDTAFGDAASIRAALVSTEFMYCAVALLAKELSTDVVLWSSTPDGRPIGFVSDPEGRRTAPLAFLRRGQDPAELEDDRFRINSLILWRQGDSREAERLCSERLARKPASR